MPSNLTCSMAAGGAEAAPPSRPPRPSADKVAKIAAVLGVVACRSLKLPLYTQRPEDLAEQLPRIEQLLAWLHHARQVLEAPQMDRLYGDLKKLHELAELPISDELLRKISAALRCKPEELRQWDKAA